VSDELAGRGDVHVAGDESNVWLYVRGQSIVHAAAARPSLN